jgi:hypothetical protein
MTNLVVEEEKITDADMKYLCEKADCHNVLELCLGKDQSKQEIT